MSQNVLKIGRIANRDKEVATMEITTTMQVGEKLTGTFQGWTITVRREPTHFAIRATRPDYRGMLTAHNVDPRIAADTIQSQIRRLSLGMRPYY